MLLPSAMLSDLANARAWNTEAYICYGPGFGCMHGAPSTDFWPLPMVTRVKKLVANANDQTCMLVHGRARMAAIHLTAQEHHVHFCREWPKVG